MNIRIIAGMYGGRIIAAPGRGSTHAMSERVRNAMFNTIAADLTNATVLDAFAGSGSIGIEALSRGARKAVFIEKDRIAARIILENIDLLDANGKVIKTTVSNWLETSDPSEQFAIVFADPPYHDPQLTVVKRLLDRVMPGGLFILSHPDSVQFDHEKFVHLSTREYGTAHITYLRRK